MQHFVIKQTTLQNAASLHNLPKNVKYITKIQPHISFCIHYCHRQHKPKDNET